MVEANPKQPKKKETINSLLGIEFFGRKIAEGTDFFQIKLTRRDKDQSTTIEKRYSHFGELYNALLAQGYKDLPKLPPKKYFMGQ